MITAKTQVQTTLSQAIGVGIQRAQFEHAIAVLIGRPPADVSIAPAPLGRHHPGDAAERALRAARAPPRYRCSRAHHLQPERPRRRRRRRLLPQREPRRASATASCRMRATDGSARVRSPSRSPTRCGPSAATSAEVVFEGGLRRGQVAAALAAYYQSVASYRQTVLTAMQQVEDQLSNLRILGQQARALAQGRAARARGARHHDRRVQAAARSTSPRSCKRRRCCCPTRSTRSPCARTAFSPASA